MTTAEEKIEHLFGETFWREEGGEKWLENIDLLERQLEPLTGILLKHCAVAEGEHVLDVGCGGGSTSLMLAERVGQIGRVLGVDISEAVLAVAESRGWGIRNLEFRCADAGREDLGRGEFDLVASRFGVMFFSRPLAGFENLRRHIKPDGRLMFLCWRTLEENPWMAVPAEAAFTILPRPEPPREEPDPDAPGPFSLGEEERLKFLLDKAGFRDYRLERIDTALPMGNPEEAVHMGTHMGPASGPFEEASDKDRAAAAAAMEKAFQDYMTDDGNIVMPCTVWLVTAKP